MGRTVCAREVKRQLDREGRRWKLRGHLLHDHIEANGREAPRCICAEEHSTAYPTAMGMVDVGKTVADVATVSMAAPFVGVLRFRRPRQERRLDDRLKAWKEAREKAKTDALEPVYHEFGRDLMNVLGGRIITSGRMR